MKRSKLAFWGFIAPCLIAFSITVIIPFFLGSIIHLLTGMV